METKISRFCLWLLVFSLFTVTGAAVYEDYEFGFEVILPGDVKRESAVVSTVLGELQQTSFTAVFKMIAQDLTITSIIVDERIEGSLETISTSDYEKFVKEHVPKNRRKLLQVKRLGTQHEKSAPSGYQGYFATRKIECGVSKECDETTTITIPDNSAPIFTRTMSFLNGNKIYRVFALSKESMRSCLIPHSIAKTSIEFFKQPEVRVKTQSLTNQSPTKKLQFFDSEKEKTAINHLLEKSQGLTDQQVYNILKVRAEKGSVVAKYYLAIIYRDGWGVPKNSDRAIELFEQLALGGDVDSMWNLAEMLPKNKSDKWYRKAANLGDRDAQARLGERYYKGTEGLLQDYSKALKFTSKAAMNGSTLAQELLAEMYSRGVGVKANEVMAYAWNNVAATSFRPGPKVQRDKIGKYMSDKDLNEAQLKSRYLLDQVNRNRANLRKEKARNFFEIVVSRSQN